MTPQSQKASFPCATTVAGGFAISVKKRHTAKQDVEEMQHAPACPREAAWLGAAEQPLCNAPKQRAFPTAKGQERDQAPFTLRCSLPKPHGQKREEPCPGKSPTNSLSSDNTNKRSQNLWQRAATDRLTRRAAPQQRAMKKYVRFSTSRHAGSQNAPTHQPLHD